MPKFFALASVVLVVLPGSAGPANASSGTAGSIQLSLSKEGPAWGDFNSLVYNIHVANAGPDAATGVVVRVTGWECQGQEWSLAACTRLPGAWDSGRPLRQDIALGPIPAGGRDAFPVEVFLPDENTATIRTTVEVVRSDQLDTASVPATCVEGWNMQPDCLSDVVTVS